LTIVDMRKSVGYLQSAIEASPRFSQAYSALADAYMACCTLQSEAPWELTEKARTAALRALELDENSAEAHCAMGTVFGIGDWDWRGAERELRLAIDLKPSLVLARICYALGCLVPLGRPLDALAELCHRQDKTPALSPAA